MIEEEVGEDQLQIKYKNKNWENKISKYKLDPTLNWNLQKLFLLMIKKLKFKTIDKKEKI